MQVLRQKHENIHEELSFDGTLSRFSSLLSLFFSKQNSDCLNSPTGLLPHVVSFVERLAAERRTIHLVRCRRCCCGRQTRRCFSYNHRLRSADVFVCSAKIPIERLRSEKQKGCVLLGVTFAFRAKTLARPMRQFEK